MRGAVFGIAVGFAVASAISDPVLAREAPMKLRHTHVEPLTFADLNGWADDDHAAAFAAFRKSCNAIVNGGKPSRAARPMYGGLHRVCAQAAELGALQGNKARQFFETHFQPMRVARAGEPDGFFTGYYETEAEGSRVKTAEFNIPLYRKPGNLIVAKRRGGHRMMRSGKKLVRYYDRIARRHVNEPHREWMDANPEQAKLRRTNRSYVFFQETDLRRIRRSRARRACISRPCARWLSTNRSMSTARRSGSMRNCR
jgi:membrane-bound lytic murein transglycosylase